MKYIHIRKATTALSAYLGLLVLHEPSPWPQHSSSLSTQFPLTAWPSPRADSALNWPRSRLLSAELVRISSPKKCLVIIFTKILKLAG